MHYTCRGTLSYMAPELLHEGNDKIYNHKIDIWAIGIMTFVMLQGWTVHPYKNLKSVDDLITKILDLEQDMKKQPYYEIEKRFKWGQSQTKMCKDFLH